MSESQFKDQFMIVFLATWCANNYADFCIRGWENWPKSLPIEDASTMADDAWDKLTERLHQ